jgi:hypothetical protein
MKSDSGFSQRKQKYGITPPFLGGKDNFFSKTSFGVQRRRYLNLMPDHRVTTGHLFLSMARLSLITFLTLAFSGAALAAPGELGALSGLHARDGNQPYTSCGM